MRIDIWSDVVCPWCYIGKRRLESALDASPHKDGIELVYHSFQLDPAAPREATQSAVEMLSGKYRVSLEQAREMQSRVGAMAEAEGMHWRHDESPYVNTVDAHRLLHLAEAEYGLEAQGRLKEELLDAYFAQAANVADHALLHELAVWAGLDAARVDEVLAGKEFEDAVYADQQQAAAYGANGVPFYVVDGKYGISGAQPTELFAQVIERAWTESHPLLETIGGTDDACGPDGCAI